MSHEIGESPAVTIGTAGLASRGWRAAGLASVLALAAGAVLMPGPTSPATASTATLTEVTAVSAGENHSLALLVDGTVVAWGHNHRGQLGTGTAEAERLVPAPVVGLTDAAAIAAGYQHNLALLLDGTVVSWGSNFGGKLGYGFSDSSPHPTPQAVPGLTDVVAIAAGRDHSLALKSDGTVWAWGVNTSGQLGLGVLGGSHYSPEPVLTGANRVAGIAAGAAHSLAFTEGSGGSNVLLGWGRNAEGQLGVGSATDNRLHPVIVSAWTGANVVVSVAAGEAHTLVLDSNGAVWGAGDNTYGQIGDGTRTQRRNLRKATGLSGVTKIAAGGFHSIAANDSQYPKFWGRNTFGQLAKGDTTDALVPVTPVPSAAYARAIAAGRSHSINVLGDGGAHAAGLNSFGQLGDNTRAQREDFVDVRAADAVPVAQRRYVFEIDAVKVLTLAYGSDPNALRAEIQVASTGERVFTDYVYVGQGMTGFFDTYDRTIVPANYVGSVSAPFDQRDARGDNGERWVAARSGTSGTQAFSVSLYLGGTRVDTHQVSFTATTLGATVPPRGSKRYSFTFDENTTGTYVVYLTVARVF